MWMPIHIIANEGLATLCTIIFVAQKDSIVEANNMDALDNNLKFQEIDIGTIQSRDKYGRTPLSWAAENGHLEVVKSLLEAKAEVDSKDNSMDGRR